MTKWGGIAFGARRHHRADFHLGIVDDDTLNEPFHQLSAWGKRQRVKRGLDTLAKPLDALGQHRDIHVLLRLGIELPQLLRSAMLGLGHLLSSALKLLTLEPLCQGYIEQPRLLAFELSQDIAQRLTARV
jgi:hypothetical protein